MDPPVFGLAMVGAVAWLDPKAPVESDTDRGTSLPGRAGGGIP
jgi:hypothetical protein